MSKQSEQKYWFKTKKNPKMGWIPISVEGWITTFVGSVATVISLIVPMYLIDEYALDIQAKVFIILLGAVALISSTALMIFVAKAKSRQAA